jgi:thiamine transport system ATP-binding protein
MTSPAPALRVEGLGVRYGATVALAGVDLQVERAEVVAIVGPSGCGKSSLLRAVAGLVPALGRVQASGRALDALPAHRRGVGVVFQDHALFPHLDVAGNVAFGLVEARLTAEVRRERTRAWLARVGLAARAADDVERLSGGERQRVALARTLAPEPPLVVLDEPFASLDPGLRARLSSEVAGWLRELGAASLFVTHDLDEALAIADRIAVLRAGRLVQVATPAELVAAPADPWTARFVGHENVWTGAAASGLPVASTAGDGAVPVAVLLLADRADWRPDGGEGRSASDGAATERRPDAHGTGTEARLLGAVPRRDGWQLELDVPGWGVRVLWAARPRELPAGRPPAAGTWGRLEAPPEAWRRWEREEP